MFTYLVDKHSLPGVFSLMEKKNVFDYPVITSTIRKARINRNAIHLKGLWVIPAKAGIHGFGIFLSGSLLSQG